MFAVSPAGYQRILHVQLQYATHRDSSRCISTLTGLARGVDVLNGERLLIMIFMN